MDLADNAANDGLVKRRTLGSESRTFDMMGRLHADIFFQDRYMINEVGVKIKSTRSRDDFCLMGAMVGKVQIVQASMFVIITYSVGPTLAISRQSLDRLVGATLSQRPNLTLRQRHLPTSRRPC